MSPGSETTRAAASLAAIIVAGGSGSRAASPLDDTPKQFRGLAGRAMFEWSLEALASFGCSPLVVVVPSDRVSSTHPTIDAVVVGGGATRQASVSQGLRRVETERVLVHDAARPFVDRGTIAAVVEALNAGAKAVVPCVPPTETIKKTVEGRVAETLDRDELRMAQTPQGFVCDVLRAAHERAAADDFTGTDDAQLVERMGIEVGIVAGSPVNIKITTGNDLLFAEAMASGR